MSKSPSTLPAPAFDDPKHHLRIYLGDCLDLLAQIPESSVDLVFAEELPEQRLYRYGVQYLTPTKPRSSCRS